MLKNALKFSGFFVLFFVGLAVMIGGIATLWLYSKKFESFSSGVSVTYYSMNGCPYCEKFNPEWDKFVEQAKTMNVKTEKIMVDEKPDVVKQKGVSGFPTVRVTKEGKETDYEGQRNADALVSYVKTISG